MMGTDSAFQSLPELVAWLKRAPRGTELQAEELVRLLGDLDVPELPAVQLVQEPTTWRERLWSVPAETRLGVVEVAEALGRPKSWVYARTGPKAEEPLPHRKLDGALVFTAGELRAWIRDQEEVVAAGRMESTTMERGRLS